PDTANTQRQLLLRTPEAASSSSAYIALATTLRERIWGASQTLVRPQWRFQRCDGALGMLTQGIQLLSRQGGRFPQTPKQSADATHRSKFADEANRRKPAVERWPRSQALQTTPSWSSSR